MKTTLFHPTMGWPFFSNENEKRNSRKLAWHFHGSENKTKLFLFAILASQTKLRLLKGVLIKGNFRKTSFTFSRLKKRKWSFSDCNERFKGWATLLVSLDLSSWTFCRENELSSSPGSWDTENFWSLRLLGSNFGEISTLARMRRYNKMRRSKMLPFWW